MSSIKLFNKSLRMVNRSLNRFFHNIGSGVDRRDSPVIELENFTKKEQLGSFMDYLKKSHRENKLFTYWNDIRDDFNPGRVENDQTLILESYYREFGNKALLGGFTFDNFNADILQLLIDSDNIYELLEKLKDITYKLDVKMPSPLTLVDESTALNIKRRFAYDYDMIELTADHRYPENQYPIFFKKETGGGGDCLFYALNAALAQFNLNNARRNNIKLYNLLRDLNNISREADPVVCEKVIVETPLLEVSPTSLAAWRKEGFEIPEGHMGEEERTLPARSSTLRAIKLRSLISNELSTSIMMDDYIGYAGLTKEEQKMFWIMKSFTDSEADRIVSGPKGSHRAEAIKVMNDHATDDRMGRFSTEIDVNLFSELANINILVINGRAEGMGERRSNETIRPGLFINYISPRSAELGYQVYPTDTIIITNLGNIHYQLGAIFAGDSLKSALGDSSNEGLTQELRNFIRTFSGRVASGISKRHRHRQSKRQSKRHRHRQSKRQRS